MRILIVKTSSLGDIVHGLTVVDDIHRAHRDAVIDWVAEEAFAELPALHPGIRRTLPVAVRRWRRSLWAAPTRVEMGRFDAMLRADRYDVVLDLQGLVKSALIASRVRALRCGYDWRSAREPSASLAYDRRLRVSRRQHAIARNRELAAAALGYALHTPPTLRLRPPPGGRPEGPYVVALHATSAPAKLWPEASWRVLADRFARSGMEVLLPWGSEPERERAGRIACGIDGARVLPRLGLPALAALLAGARLTVGVDTGLAHLAAAVGCAVLALYTDSDPALTGVIGFGAPAINLGGPGRPPDAAAVLAAAESMTTTPPC